MNHNPHSRNPDNNNNSNISTNDGSRNISNNQSKSNYSTDRRRPNSNQQQYQRDRSGHRERSGQRNQGQHPDSSMSRIDSFNQTAMSNLGSVRFTPGLQTIELPTIETKLDPNKKFSGRCRLFVGNLPHNTTEDKVKRIFERFGEVGEVYLGPKSAFGFVKMDTRQNAEAARDALDCTNFEGRSLRVRLAAHAAAIRVKNLPSQVTNELLAYSFRYFGEIERAVVVVDDKGKSTGDGIVEYARKQSAQYAIKKCQQECFMLTSLPQPVLVEAYDQQDEDEGLPEKSINKNSTEFKEQRETGPRFADQGTFEHTFGMRWKDLYALEKQKRDNLEQEIQEARSNLQNQIDYSKVEHDAMQLRNRLQELDDYRVKLQQMKEQTMNDSQKREEHRRKQDMLLRQREEDLLQRQQAASDPNGFNQQDNALQQQASKFQEFLNSQAQVPSVATQIDPKFKQQPSSSQIGQGIDTNMPMGPIHLGAQMANQPGSYVEPSMVGMNQPPPFIPISTAMGPAPTQATPNMFTAFMQQQQQPHPMQMPDESSNNQEVLEPSYDMQQYREPNQRRGGQGRQNNSKMGRQFPTSGNNNSMPGRNGRPRKRGKY